MKRQPAHEQVTLTRLVNEARLFPRIATVLKCAGDKATLFNDALHPTTYATRKIRDYISLGRSSLAIATARLRIRGYDRTGSPVCEQPEHQCQNRENCARRFHDARLWRNRAQEMLSHNKGNSCLSSRCSRFVWETVTHGFSRKSAFAYGRKKNILGTIFACVTLRK